MDDLPVFRPDGIEHGQALIDLRAAASVAEMGRVLVVEEEDGVVYVSELQGKGMLDRLARHAVTGRYSDGNGEPGVGEIEVLGRKLST